MRDLLTTITVKDIVLSDILYVLVLVYAAGLAFFLGYLLGLIWIALL